MHQAFFNFQNLTLLPDTTNLSIVVILNGAMPVLLGSDYYNFGMGSRPALLRNDLDADPDEALIEGIQMNGS